MQFFPVFISFRSVVSVRAICDDAYRVLMFQDKEQICGTQGCDPGMKNPTTGNWKNVTRKITPAN
jgi:hypothetical protein